MLRQAYVSKHLSWVRANIAVENEELSTILCPQIAEGSPTLREVLLIVQSSPEAQSPPSTRRRTCAADATHRSFMQLVAPIARLSLNEHTEHSSIIGQTPHSRSELNPLMQVGCSHPCAQCPPSREERTVSKVPRRPGCTCLAPSFAVVASPRSAGPSFIIHFEAARTVPVPAGAPEHISPYLPGYILICPDRIFQADDSVSFNGLAKLDTSMFAFLLPKLPAKRDCDHPTISRKVGGH